MDCDKFGSDEGSEEINGVTMPGNSASRQCGLFGGVHGTVYNGDRGRTFMNEKETYKSRCDCCLKPFQLLENIGADIESTDNGSKVLFDDEKLKIPLYIGHVVR